MAEGNREILNDHGPDEKPPSASSNLVVWLFVLVVVVALVVVIFPKRHGPHIQGSSVQCLSNLRQIGMLCQQYAAQHDKSWPDSFATLYCDQAKGTHRTGFASLFVCPTSGGKRVQALTTQQEASMLSVPQTCSYLYLGNENPRKVKSSDRIVAFEVSPSGHGSKKNRYFYVLFADGSVVQVPADRHPNLLTRYNRGQREMKRTDIDTPAETPTPTPPATRSTDHQQGVAWASRQSSK